MQSTAAGCVCVCTCVSALDNKASVINGQIFEVCIYIQWISVEWDEMGYCCVTIMHSGTADLVHVVLLL